MTQHLGRLIDHIHLRVTDFDRSSQFYSAVLDSLSLGCGATMGRDWLECDELFIDEIDHGGLPSRVHLAFQARDRATVEAAHKAGLAAGGTCNGAPGLRDYHPGYYAAYLLDPDGNNIEIKCDERPCRRSAAAVTIDQD